jgi:hypothetical protein
MRISTTLKVSSVVLGPKKLEIWGEKSCENCTRAEETKYCAMKLSQIRRKIELCMRDIILCFEMNLFYFFLDSSFIHIRIFKYRSTYVYLLGCRDPRGLTVHQQRHLPTGLNVKLIHNQFGCTRWAFRLLNWDGRLLSCDVSLWRQEVIPVIYNQIILSLSENTVGWGGVGKITPSLYGLDLRMQGYLIYQ